MSGQSMTTAYIRPRRSAWWHRAQSGSLTITNGALFAPEPPDDEYPPPFRTRASARVNSIGTRCGRVYDGQGYAVSLCRPDRGRFCGRCG